MYTLFDNGFSNVENMALGQTITERQADKIVREILPKFVKSVVILGNRWFMCTSFNVFFHQKNVDDCTDSSCVGYQDKIAAFIREKTKMGTGFFEYTIRFKNIELLATDGFFGPLEGYPITAFFGSSVQNLPDIITERFDTVYSKAVFITNNTKPSINNRISIKINNKISFINSLLALITRFTLHFICSFKTSAISFFFI